MFAAFEAELDNEAPRRLAISIGAAMAVLGALGFGAMVISGRITPEQEAEQMVDVSFRPPPPPPPPAKIENPPPPPPPKVARAAVPPAEAPTPAVDVPAPAAAALVAPKEIPTKAAPEVAPEQAVAERHLAVGGSGTGAGNGAGAEESPEPVSAAAGGGPVNLPEDADPPEPSEANVMPEYPEAERTVGHESVVILKIVIEADGRVGRIIVMKGDEPFLAAALSAVRSWHYEPAKLDGQSIATFKIVKIPFRLKT